MGVTDALDDLETEEDNTLSKNIRDKFKQNESCDSNKHFQQKKDQSVLKKSQEHQGLGSINSIFSKQKDLREVLREKSYIQHESHIEDTYSNFIEDDDQEKTKEKRNRFPTERVMNNTKMNKNIPDSLENVLTTEHKSQEKNSDKDCRDEKKDKVEKNDRRSNRGRFGGKYENIHQSGR